MTNSNWTCNCGEPDCQQCGTNWARPDEANPDKEVVQEWQGGLVRLLADGTYEVNF